MAIQHRIKLSLRPGLFFLLFVGGSFCSCALPPDAAILKGCCELGITASEGDAVQLWTNERGCGQDVRQGCKVRGFPLCTVDQLITCKWLRLTNNRSSLESRLHWEKRPCIRLDCRLHARKRADVRSSSVVRSVTPTCRIERCAPNGSCLFRND